MRREALLTEEALEVLPPVRGYWREFWRRFSRNRRATISLVIIAGMFITGIFTEELAPYCHTTQNLRAVDQEPSLAHLLGTDNLGRDLLSRLVWGARTAAIVSVTVILLELVVGVPLGALAGYFGGKIDSAIMRVADLLFAFPEFLFVLFIAATVRPSILTLIKDIGGSLGLKRGVNCAADYVSFADFVVVIAALSFVGWPGLARLVRGLFLSLREREFVEAARAMGAPHARIIFNHLLPNALPTLIVAMSLGMGGAILAETSLSFLGIGIQPPNASWGNTILENYTFWRTRPYMILIPGSVLAVVVLAFNFLGEGLNEALNPKT
ncbi:MAG: ABC transporter permease [Chloroflexi bacterium]|nr:ABC transporter permease [Chloroflexota bacterium]